MKQKFKRIFALIMSVILMLPAFSFPSFAADKQVGYFHVAWNDNVTNGFRHYAIRYNAANSRFNLVDIGTESVVGKLDIQIEDTAIIIQPSSERGQNVLANCSDHNYWISDIETDESPASGKEVLSAIVNMVDASVMDGDAGVSTSINTTVSRYVFSYRALVFLGDTGNVEVGPYHITKKDTTAVSLEDIDNGLGTISSDNHALISKESAVKLLNYISSVSGSIGDEETDNYISWVSSSLNDQNVAMNNLATLYSRLNEDRINSILGQQSGSQAAQQSTRRELTKANGSDLPDIGTLTKDSKLTKDEGWDVDDNGNALVWEHWYMTALYLITGTERKGGIFNNPRVLKDNDSGEIYPLMSADVGGTATPLYDSYAYLKILLEQKSGKQEPSDTDWRYLYEILSLLNMGTGQYGSAIGDWLGSGVDLEEEIKTARDKIAEKDNTSKVAQDSDALNQLVTSIKNDSTATMDNDTRHMTIGSRLQALIIGLQLENLDLSGSDWDWVSAYYDGSAWRIFADLLDGKMLPYIKVNNTSHPQFAMQAGTNQETLGEYIIRTIYEVPDFMQTEMVAMNDAISANTEMTDNKYYKAIKNIKDAKDKLQMPALDYFWELEMEPDDTATNVQYKSMAKVWEEMNALATGASIEDNPESAPPLETGKPMKWFFADYNTGKLSDYYLQGIGYTATLVPMRSNVYSKEWLKYLDYDFFEDFYYRWGFNRKALFIDTSSGSVESYFSQGDEEKTRGRTKVCTLRDLVNSKGDVTLYLDDNFYNCKNIQERYQSLQTSGRTNYNSGALDTAMATDEATAESGNKEKYTDNVFNRYGWWTTVAANIEEMYGTDFENIVKTNESTNYSKTFYDMMSKLDGGHVYYPEASADNVGNNDNAVLSSGRINYYLNSENAGSEVYSPIQGYAVVSSVYRDADLFNVANSAAIQRPVFMASQTAPYMKNAPLEACETIFNWALLKNLKDAMPVGYAGNIDMDCPIYMDILGNIVTESGTVVVPAASNATIMEPSFYYANMYAAGLFSVYGLGYYIPVKENESSVFSQMMEVAFMKDDTGKYYIAAPRTVGDDTKIDMSRLSASSKTTLDILYQQTWAKLYNIEGNNSGYNFDNYFNICMEVLRGAPMESIDKEQEGIDTSNRIDRAGIVAAAKLEELNEALATGAENTTLYIPNLAFMPGLTYVAMMAFKILMLVVILVSMATVYFDAVSESLGIGTAWKCIQALLITMLTLFTVPAVFEATYYQSNRALLQDEAIRIAMLNYEKSAAGVEIGVTEVKEPDISSVLYLRLQDIKVPWYELFYDSIFTNSYASLKDMYENYAVEHSFIANAPDVEVKNDGVYVDVQKVFESSSVDLSMAVEDSDIRRLVQTASVQTTSLSFYSPYYAILDALIQNVNYFNDNPWGENSGDSADTKGWYSYTTTEQKGGKIKTMGLIEPYFTSEKFLYEDNKDPLGLNFIYSPLASTTVAADPAIAGYYSNENLVAMRNSGWYASDISRAECDKRLEYMTERARRFVAKNRELLGKISDDTFLKAMALSLAIDHNRAFGAQSCASLELYNLSNDDLIRLSIADRDEVMINSTLSYPRFVYTVGGSPAVFAAALLSMVMWISGIVKPLLVIVAFVTIFVSIFIFRVCMRKEGTSIYGYFITALLLSFTNICYSLMLKASMFLPSLHFTPFMCILVQIILQIAYMVILLNVVGTAFRDWRDLGYARYANKTQDMRLGFLSFFSKTKNASNPFYGGSTKISDPEKNWGYYDDMMEERKRRAR